MLYQQNLCLQAQQMTESFQNGNLSVTLNDNSTAVVFATKARLFGIEAKQILGNEIVNEYTYGANPCYSGGKWITNNTGKDIIAGGSPTTRGITIPFKATSYNFIYME